MKRDNTQKARHDNILELTPTQLSEVNGGAIINLQILEKDDLTRLIHRHAAQIRAGVSPGNLDDPAVIVD